MSSNAPYSGAWLLQTRQGIAHLVLSSRRSIGDHGHINSPDGTPCVGAPNNTTWRRIVRAQGSNESVCVVAGVVCGWVSVRVSEQAIGCGLFAPPPLTQELAVLLNLHADIKDLLNGFLETMEVVVDESCRGEREWVRRVSATFRSQKRELTLALLLSHLCVRIKLCIRL